MCPVCSVTSVPGPDQWFCLTRFRVRTVRARGWLAGSSLARVKRALMTSRGEANEKSRRDPRFALSAHAWRPQARVL
jgi:hypothetical protein